MANALIIDGPYIGRIFPFNEAYRMIEAVDPSSYKTAIDNSNYAGEFKKIIYVVHPMDLFGFKFFVGTTCKPDDLDKVMFDYFIRPGAAERIGVVTNV
jgi:hypothetical protein